MPFLGYLASEHTLLLSRLVREGTGKEREKITVVLIKISSRTVSQLSSPA